MAEFNYYDQYSDVDIDLTDYLNKLVEDNDLTTEQYTFNNNQPIKTTIKNLFEHINIIYDYRDDAEVINTYEVQDGEFPEVVSYKLYEDASFWWIILLFNEIYDPYNDWVLSQSHVIDLATRLFNAERKFSYQTYIDFIHTANEERRNIIYPKKYVLKDIVWKYREVLLNG